jgi:hypothetical protein
MNEERHRILDMLAAGKVSVADAEKLLAALGDPSGAPSARGSQGVQGTRDPKFLRVQVDGYLDPTMPGGKVNVRVPFNLLRAGVKLAALLPAGVGDQINKALKQNGMDVDVTKVKTEDLEGIVEQLGEMTVEVDGPKGERVRVFCE